MNWYIFCCVSLVALFCIVHGEFLKQFNVMKDLGLDVEIDGTPLHAASTAFTFLASINLIVFFIFFGIDRGWILALATLFGGIFAASLYWFVLVKTNMHLQILSSLHKSSWLGLPALSIGIWLLFYDINPLK